MSVISETTDAAASTATIYRMEVWDTFLGGESTGSSDWIAITLTAGTRYSFGVVGLGPLDSGMTDPLIKLRSANGTVLAEDDDDGPGYMADLDFTATVTGTYYIEVRSLAGATNGDYGLVAAEGALPSYGAELAAGILYRPGLGWNDVPGEGVTLTWGVRASGPAKDAQGNTAPFTVLSGAQIAAVEDALDNFSDVSGLVFNRVNAGGTTNNATILAGSYTSTTDGAGAYAWFPGNSAPSAKEGDLWLNNDSVSRTDIPVGSYDYWVMLHELGHALGLDHPGDYNAGPGVTITYQNSAQFIEDSNQYTVMSYFAATDTEPDCPTTYADTLMLYDIYALQVMYGVNSGARTGNDTYGFNATLGGAYDFRVNTDPLMCIWDAGGRDTLDLSGFGGRQVIDLNDGAFSNVGGFKGNLSIAWGAVIENAVGGRGADQIYGNEVANQMKGGRGADYIWSAGGNDRMTGNTGADDFAFYIGDGRDRVTDFDVTQDQIALWAELWNLASKTAAQVVNQYAVIRNGVVVLDFGADELTLQGVTSTAGLADTLVLY